jgi:hypothetical protein
VRSSRWLGADRTPCYQDRRTLAQNVRRRCRNPWVGPTLAVVACDNPGRPLSMAAWSTDEAGRNVMR